MHSAESEFEIRESLESRWLRLTLLGELDMSVGRQLEGRLRELQVEQRSVLIDLSRLDFMDSTGLAIMIRAINASRSNGWAFMIDPNLAPQVRSLFKVTAVDQLVGIDAIDPPSA
jgi:anti-anti-sigma factor